jgi:hypothetical protein
MARQTSFFESDTDTRTSGVPARTARERKTDPKARALDRLLARVEALREQVKNRLRSLEDGVVFHAAEVQPRLQDLTGLRKDFVRALWPYTIGKRIGGGDRRALMDLVGAQVEEILAHDASPETDIQAIFQELNGMSLQQAVQSELDEARSWMAGMFDEVGLDVDVPELRPDMTEEDVAALGARMRERLEQRCRDAAGEAASRSPRPGSRAARREAREEEQRRRVEQMRKISIGATYRRLVKALHPDLERDPVERERKIAAMQEVTTAYANRDVLQILRLERTWLGTASTEIGTHADADTRDAYTQLLKEQAQALRLELETLHMHPRFSTLIVEGPFGFPQVMDGPAEVESLETRLGYFREVLHDLAGPQALAIVRALIREHKAMTRQQEKWTRSFVPGPFAGDDDLPPLPRPRLGGPGGKRRTRRKSGSRK